MNLPVNTINILKKNNPFLSSSVGDPWISKYPDVLSINEHAFNGIKDLMLHKSDNPALNCACLILGEVGSGKTHLISRMLNYSKKSDFEFTFSYIQPIEDSGQIFSYLLKETIVNLCYPLENRIFGSLWDSQLYRLVDNIIKEVEPNYRFHSSMNTALFNSVHSGIKKKSILKRLQNKILDFSLLTSNENNGKITNKYYKKAIDLLRRTYPEISKKLLYILFDYVNPNTQAVAIEWLKGNVLDEEDSNMLHVLDKSRLSIPALEHEAREILISIGILLGRYKMPMLVCFDRLENLDTDLQIHALGKMIEFLVDKVQAMLPLVCFRGQQWEEKFRYKLNQHVVSRLSNNQFSLKACNDSQAIEIIESRLNSVLGNRGIEQLPLNIDELQDMFHDRLYSPRNIINMANEKLRNFLNQKPEKKELPIEQIQKIFDKQKKTILENLDRFPPDRGRLRKALNLFMAYRPEKNVFGQVESFKTNFDDNDQFDLVVKIKYSEEISAPSIFIIDLDLHHMSVKARIQKGISCLIEHSPVKVVYIRDARCNFPPPPKWKETNNLLQRFKRLGGNVFFLGHENVASWYALSMLSYAIKEGDISIIDDKNLLRPVAWQEFEAFIKERINGNDCPSFSGMEEALCSPPSEKVAIIKKQN